MLPPPLVAWPAANAIARAAAGVLRPAVQRIGNRRMRALPSPRTTRLPVLSASPTRSRLSTTSFESCSTRRPLDPSDVDDRWPSRPCGCQDRPEVGVSRDQCPFFDSSSVEDNLVGCVASRDRDLTCAPRHDHAVPAPLPSAATSSDPPGTSRRTGQGQLPFANRLRRVAEGLSHVVRLQVGEVVEDFLD